MDVPENLCLAFSIDSSKISAVAYENQFADASANNSATKVPKIHAFSQVECSLFSGGGLKSIRLATDAIIELTEEIERQSGSQYIDACLTFSSKTLRLGGKSTILNVRGKKLGKTDIDTLHKISRSTVVPNAEWLCYFRCLSPFRLDKETISNDPIGLAHNAIAQTEVTFSERKTTLANIIEVFRNSGLNIKRIFPQPAAAAFASTFAHERQHGIAVVDIGANLIQIICYKDLLPRYLAVIPRGSALITQDLSVCLQIDLKEAEAIKKNVVCFQTQFSASEQTKHGSLAPEIATARADETIKMIKRTLETQLRPSDYKSGIVLIGRGAKLKGLLSQIRSQIHPLCRISTEYGLAGLSESMDDLGLAPLAGLVKLDSADFENNEFFVPNQELQKKRNKIFGLFRLV